MPTDAADVYCTVHKHGTATFLARVVGPDAEPVAPADVVSVRYGLYLLEDQEPDARTPVAGHEGVDLTVDNVLLASLQTGAPWTRDAVGYNFRHTLEVAAAEAFTIAGRSHLLEYRLVPRVGQVILLRFRIHVI